MLKIVIIGEKEDILPYQSIGVEIEPVKTTADTVSALRKTAQNPQVTIILITENMAEQCLDTIHGIKKQNSQGDYHCPHGAGKQTHQHDRTQQRNWTRRGYGHFNKNRIVHHRGTENAEKAKESILLVTIANVKRKLSLRGGTVCEAKPKQTIGKIPHFVRNRLRNLKTGIALRCSRRSQ